MYLQANTGQRTYLCRTVPRMALTVLRILTGIIHPQKTQKNSSAYGKYENGHFGRWHIKPTPCKRFLN